MTITGALTGTHTHAATGVPRLSVLVVSSIVILTLVFVPDVATAGAAASLIFLIYFRVLPHQQKFVVVEIGV